MSYTAKDNAAYKRAIEQRLARAVYDVKENTPRARSAQRWIDTGPWPATTGKSRAKARAWLATLNISESSPNRPFLHPPT